MLFFLQVQNVEEFQYVEIFICFFNVCVCVKKTCAITGLQGDRLMSSLLRSVLDKYKTIPPQFSMIIQSLVLIYSIFFNSC